jgi:adenosylcobinamide-phosphate synthase
MSARLDSAANFIPARITAALIVISSIIVHADWHCSIKILKRDRANTSSLNAGYPMASVAGALGVRLEKIGHYTLGDNYDNISIKKCELALSIMKLTSILFCFMFTLPVMLILNIIGWWTLIFGH